MLIPESKNLAAIRRSISARLQRHGGLYERVRVRAAAVKDSGGWALAWCDVQAYAPGESPPAETTRDYGDALLVETWIDPANIDAFLDDAGSGTIAVDGRKLTLSFQDMHLEEHTPTSPWRGGRPVVDYMLMGKLAHRPYTALASPIHEYFPDIYAAIAIWVQPPKKIQGAADSGLGGVHVHLPECRAFMRKLEHENGKLTVTTSFIDAIGPSLRLRGRYWRRHETVALMNDRVSESTTFDLPHDIYRLELLLLLDVGEMLDCHIERPTIDGRVPPRGFVMNLTPTADPDADEARVEHAILSGEGVQVEFKPFVPIRDGKFEEIIKTVIAFANTSGGVVYIGIDNHCVPCRSVDDAFSKSGVRDFRDWIAAYLGDIRQRLAEELNSMPPLQIRHVTFRGQTVVLVDVTPGGATPYLDRRSNEIWVRRGPNCVRPDVVTELPPLLNRTRQS